MAQDTSMWATESSAMYFSLSKAFVILKGGRKCCSNTMVYLALCQSHSEDTAETKAQRDTF